MDKRVEVKLDGIYCEWVDGDPGGNLEIRGWLAARVFDVRTGTTRQSVEMFKPRSGHVSIHQSNMFPVNKTVILNLPQGEWIHLGGHLKEVDTFGQDDMGERWEKIYSGSIDRRERPIPVRYEHSGQVVRADYKIKEI
ncbi:hypothetical protein [Salipaludibacillus aurantiacus]|uniref:Uncharacterized protein n=1 Tax=Salipaludibacillus aurantiacus TaxID=1601833 RepID=A0A1H9UTN6_9BACI|nr:hypothetical protein [Salipaludibacillus aurantiacus]SES12701.1 hypothetical protein SAMN05518684_108163 [Salipaludibacillus aurantiacus]